MKGRLLFFALACVACVACGSSPTTTERVLDAAADVAGDVLEHEDLDAAADAGDVLEHEDLDAAADAGDVLDAGDAALWCFFCDGVKTCAAKCVYCQGGMYCAPVVP